MRARPDTCALRSTRDILKSARARVQLLTLGIHKNELILVHKTKKEVRHCWQGRIYKSSHSTGLIYIPVSQTTSYLQSSFQNYNNSILNVKLDN